MYATHASSPALPLFPLPASKWTNPHILGLPDLNHSLQMLPITLPRHNIKSRFGTEPTRPRTAHSLIRKAGILLLDLDRLASPPPRSRISHQLRLTALLETNEPEDRSFDRLGHGQKPMILQQRRLLVAKTGSNVLPFFFREDHAIELAIHDVVVVKGTRVLRDAI